MRNAVLAVVIGLVCIVGTASATIPDPALCSVDPNDGFLGVVTYPDPDPGGPATMNINVRNGDNENIPNAYVQIIYLVPGNHCFCPGVVLDGSGLSTGDGLTIRGADGVVVRGLQILNFPGDGIVLTGGARDAVLGGDSAIGTAPLGQGNLISNNHYAGVVLEGAGTNGNQVLGNYIGTDLTGDVALGR